MRRGSGCTRAFANALLRALVNSTLSDVARLHRISYDFLRGLVEREVRAEVNWGRITSLRVLGLDEIALLKGHRDFVTIVSTRDEQSGPVLLAVLEGREKETIVAFLRTIPAALRATVEEVCTDLYEGFAGAVKEVLPSARVVADRFHVAKLYGAAVDALRKSEMKELKQALLPAEYAGLRGVLWAFRRHRHDLSAEELELLELLFQCAPQLRTAYALREELFLIFEKRQSKAAAHRAMTAWIGKVRRSGLDCFDSFLGTLERWIDEITNYFVGRQTSGWVEGFNNKIKVLKRRCYVSGSTTS